MQDYDDAQKVCGHFHGCFQTFVERFYIVKRWPNLVRDFYLTSFYQQLGLRFNKFPAFSSQPITYIFLKFLNVHLFLTLLDNPNFFHDIYSLLQVIQGIT